jgi:hypothetical protein
MKKTANPCKHFCPFLTSWCPQCPILSCLSHLFNPDRVVPSYRPYLGNPSPSIPAQAVLSWLSYSGCSFLAIPSRLSYQSDPTSPILPVLSYQSDLTSPILLVLSCQSCTDCPFFQTCSDCTILTVLSLF